MVPNGRFQGLLPTLQLGLRQAIQEKQKPEHRSQRSAVSSRDRGEKPPMIRQCRSTGPRRLRGFFCPASHRLARWPTRDVTFDELLEIPQILAEGAGQNYRLDNRANFDGHSCRAARKWIEDDHADAKMFRRSLPCNPPIWHAGRLTFRFGRNADS